MAVAISSPKNSFDSRAVLQVGQEEYNYYRLRVLQKLGFPVERLPFSIRILLENVLRHENGKSVTAEDIRSVARWDARAASQPEIAFIPSRVLLQDFTGVPAVVDLAAMRDAMDRLGGDPQAINPLSPVELVIDHSVQVDEFGTPTAFHTNAELEFLRNRERYAFLRWGSSAFDNFEVVPPDTGIVHQVNLEYLARVVFTSQPGKTSGRRLAYPDTLIGTDSHTTMINGLGVLGWGVGGIEAEAAMLGQPVSMLIPQVVGFRLTGALPEGSTATDLVLTITEMLRRKGVVGKFVEFYGPGLPALPLADRATIANMAPEYGATCGFFPVDEETLRYLRFTGRPEQQVALVEAYCREQLLFHLEDGPEIAYSDNLELDLGAVVPSAAGPKRPQDRVALDQVHSSFRAALPTLQVTSGAKSPPKQLGRWEGEGGNPSPPGPDDPAGLPANQVSPTHAAQGLDHGSVVIAAITSCTNTSNPVVMVAAGLLAKKAVERGLRSKPWVKTSLAPGSKVVSEYYDRAGLTPCLEQLGFNLVGYGCTTCIGNSGPLPAAIAQRIQERELVAVAVLSGNRNFEGRINPDVRANYLMSPPLVVAYALAGRIDIDITREPLGNDQQNQPVYLRDLWPSQQEVADVIGDAIQSDMFRKSYADVFKGDEHWHSLAVPQGRTFAWDAGSTYIKEPPYFQDMLQDPPAVQDILGARVLALLGHSVTTDHISPAGSIKVDSPAGRYLQEQGVEPKDFNSYGSRRGNHEVMVRGTFASVRLRNKLAPGTEGGVTRHLPDGEQLSIFDAAERYKASGTPTIVIAGKEYGSGSSRDWAAKGPLLLGVRAVIAQSYERIHRSNLVGMGILPLQFHDEEDYEALGLKGEETYDISGLAAVLAGGCASRCEVTVKATCADGTTSTFHAIARLDTPQELLYYQHGGILPYVLRQRLAGRKRPEIVSRGMSTVADPATGSTVT